MFSTFRLRDFQSHLASFSLVSALSLSMATGADAATTVTFDALYDEIAEVCVSNGSQDGIDYHNPASCGRRDHAYLLGGRTDFPGLTLTAGTVVEEFDLLALEIVNSFPEVLSVAKDGLPDTIDPTTPDGYLYLWENNLWSLTPVENLQIRGYRNTVLVAERSYYIPDSCGILGCFSDLLPNADAPFGTLFSDLDRLEISVVNGFGPATDLGVHEDASRWYTCLGPCGHLVIDNVQLDITRTPTTPPVPPSPVPLPMALWLLMAPLAALLGASRRLRR